MSLLRLARRQENRPVQIDSICRRMKGCENAAGHDPTTQKYKTSEYFIFINASSFFAQTIRLWKFEAWHVEH